MVWLEIIGWVGSALLVWSLLQTRILRLRAINLVGCVVLIAYNAMVPVWPMLGLNLVLCVINVVQLVRLVRTRHDERSYDVVAVDPDGELVQRLLERHRADITRFNPDFSWPPPEPGRRFAYVVLSANEIAGLVLVRDAGDGVARIALDYVTPRYRDFSPGQFVFRRSGIFTAMGFRRVITPPGMVGAYYGRLGFRAEDSSHVLDLAPAQRT